MEGWKGMESFAAEEEPEVRSGREDGGGKKK